MLGAVGVLRPEHIPIADIERIVIECIVGVLEQVLPKAVRKVGKEVVAVARNRRRRTREDAFHRHAHAVDDRAVHARSGVFETGVQTLRRFAERYGVLKAERNGSLTVHLDKADALSAEHLVPVAVEACAAHRVGHQPSACRAAQVGRFLYGDRTAGRNAAPIAHQRVPYAEPPDAGALAQLRCQPAKALRKLFFVRLKRIEQAVLERQPAVVDDHPLDRDLLFGKLRRLFADTLFVDVGVKGVPAAPAEIAEHLGQPPLCARTDMLGARRLRKDKRDRFADRGRFGVPIERLV